MNQRSILANACRLTRLHASRRVGLGLAMLVAAVGLLAFSAGPARSQTTIGTPAVTGDQLIFFYDARSGRVPFLSVSNPSNATIFIEVAFYPSSLASRLGSQSYTLPAGGNVVIDPTSSDVAGGAANGNVGLAIVTPVAAAGSTQAVVPPEPLAGSFTLANTALAAAFGENPFGRLAVTGAGARAQAGASVNGSAVKYQRFTPPVLMIPAHFNPQTLASPEEDGNRVILAAFADHYGTAFDVTAASDNPVVTFLDSAGVQVAERTVALNGVLATNLQELAGGAEVLAKSGKAFLDVNPGNNNIFGVFSQALGTFASGQRLAAVDIVPDGVPASPSPTPTKTPSGGPTPTKTPVGGPTPTKTPAGGPTPTKTPAGGPTPTPGAGACTKLTVTVTTTFEPSQGDPISGVTAAIDYPEGKVTLPGVGGGPDVQGRVTNQTGVSGGIFSVGDDDSVLNIGLVSLSAAIPPGAFAQAVFDCVAGQAPPVAANFTCSAVVSSMLGLEVPGTCSVSVTPS